VEILVVMVVLVVGIFTVIRIFPIGFDLLQYTGNAGVAHRLADAEVEFWRNNSDNLPEAIVSTLPGGPASLEAVDPIGYRPTDFLSGTGGPGDDTTLRADITNALKGYYGSAADQMADLWVGPNQARRIMGEVVTIPAPSPIQNGVDKAASVYTLAFAPIEWGANGAGVTALEAEQYIQITGQPFSRIDVSGMPQESLNATVGRLRPREYAIDYEKGLVYLPPSTQPRQLIANYSYLVKGSNTPRTVPAPDQLFVPATPATSPVPGSVVKLNVQVNGSPVYDNGFSRIVVGSDRVSPRFRYLPSNQPFSRDPYEFKMLSNYSLGIQFSGAIAFNPNGFNQSEPGVNGTLEPLRPSVTYSAKDWRILRQEVTLPALPSVDDSGNKFYRVRLALPNLKQAGVTTEENSLLPWAGLAGTNPAYSVVAVNPADGTIVTNSVAPNDGGFDVDYKNGVLTFPENVKAYSPSQQTESIPSAGLTLRVYYEVEGGWAVVPQKAYSNYRIATDWSYPDGRNDPLATVGSVVMPPQIATDINGKPFVRLVFPIPDEGKSVAVDFTYRDDNGGLKTLYNQDVQISSEARQSAGESWWYRVNPNDLNERPKPYGRIYLPSHADVKDFSKDFILQRVEGSSFRAVTVWQDRSRWRQEAVNAYMVRTLPK
jgi:hypothetical protein